MSTEAETQAAEGPGGPMDGIQRQLRSKRLCTAAARGKHAQARTAGWTTEPATP
jgi:hypothetical protein